MNRQHNHDRSDSISRSSGSLASQQAMEMVERHHHQSNGQLHHNHNHHHHHNNSPRLSVSDETRSHRLDLYSVPVFILEALVLIALANGAYYLHYEYYIEPFVSGFYCDDISLRQKFAKSEFTTQFIQEENELIVLALLIAVPITLIIFCELVNSMFGSLRFRKIRALCKCCKLHSITRRAIRFSGAYLLGFLLVSISCDVLSTASGRLRPYFAQDCVNAYQQYCNGVGSLNSMLSRELQPETVAKDLKSSSSEMITIGSVHFSSLPSTSSPRSNLSLTNANQPIASPLSDGSRIKETIMLPERRWIDLTHGPTLNEICQFPESATRGELYAFHQLAKSWPSHPAAIITYACFFLAAYLSFAGTARPIRIISCVLILGLFILAVSFDVQLVKEHFHHWEDVLAGATLAAFVVFFVVIVYLNMFRDTHYYERQKLYPSRQSFVHENVRPYSSNSAFGNYNLNNSNLNNNKINDPTELDGEMLSAGIDNPSSNNNAYNNDLAMRYFQIPRANYRGAPRPLSSLNNQMR